MMPLMPVLRSDDPDMEIDKSESWSSTMLKDLRRISFIGGWAAAVLLATTGWLYFIARGAWFLFDWLLG
jgi:hypothetical protein